MDAFKRVQNEQIRIPGYQVGRVAVDGKRKKFVVLGIATCEYLPGYFNPLRLSRQCRKKAPDVLLVNITAELLTAEDFEQFREGVEGK